MKSPLLWTIILAVLLLFTSSRMSNPELTKDYKSDPRWTEVKDFEKKGLTRSAWDVVNLIYADAEKKGDDQTQYKALCHQLRYSQQIEEEAETSAIDRLLELANKGEQPIASLAHSMLASTYWAYFTSHSWQILERTRIEGDKGKDIHFWDAEEFIRSVNYHCIESLRDKESLKAISLSSLDPELLTSSENLDRLPRLYDLLAHRALRFYSDSRSGLTEGKDAFQFNSSEFYGPASEFTKMKLSEDKPFSFNLNALWLFQELLKEQDSESTEWLHTDLMRLKFVQSKNSYEKPNRSMVNEAYFDGLAIALNRHKANPLMAEYLYEQALTLKNDGNDYNFGKKAEKKDRLKEAMAHCERLLSDFLIHMELNFAKTCAPS